MEMMSQPKNDVAELGLSNFCTVPTSCIPNIHFKTIFISTFANLELIVDIKYHVRGFGLCVFAHPVILCSALLCSREDGVSGRLLSSRNSGPEHHELR